MKPFRIAVLRALTIAALALSFALVTAGPVLADDPIDGGSVIIPGPCSPDDPGFGDDLGTPIPLSPDDPGFE